MKTLPRDFIEDYELTNYIKDINEDLIEYKKSMIMMPLHIIFPHTKKSEKIVFEKGDRMILNGLYSEQIIKNMIPRVHTISSLNEQQTVISNSETKIMPKLAESLVNEYNEYFDQFDEMVGDLEE